MLKRITVSLTIGLLAPSAAVVAIGSTAHADVNGCKYRNRTNPLRYDTSQMDHGTGELREMRRATVVGARGWNKSRIPKNFKRVTSAWTHLDVYTVRLPLDVWASVQPEACADFNRPLERWTSNDAILTWNRRARGIRPQRRKNRVASHELGHVLGLAHLLFNGCGGRRTVVVQGEVKWLCDWPRPPYAIDTRDVRRIY